MESAQPVKQLLLAIQEDRKRYIALETLLIKQRELMIGHKTEALEALNLQLTELYNVLDNTASERRLLMQQLQLPADPAGMQQLLSRLPPDYREHANALWADLYLRANACHQQNEHNGQLLTQQQALLASLTEHPSAFLYTG